MTRIEAENNKAKWAAFGKTRNAAGRKVISTKEKCNETVKTDEEPLKEPNKKK